MPVLQRSEPTRDSMQSEWHGAYLDGRSAVRMPATIRPMQSGLEIILKDGRTLWWPYIEIRQTQGVYAGEEIRFERGEPLPEALIIDSQSFLNALRERAPDWAVRFHSSRRRWLQGRMTMYAVTAATVGVAALYLWGIPMLAATFASHVPSSWEERLGREALGQLAPESDRCHDPEVARVLDLIEARLLSTRTDRLDAFHIIVVDQDDVNAFAVPGGSIVVFRGLIDQTDNPGELAGVLAHEMQHLLLHHTTQQLFQQASTSLLIALMTGGQTSGAAAFGLKSAEAIGMLRYSRTHEAEADLEGMKMLIAAGIDPHGMLTFLETLKHEEPEIPDAMKYLDNHPQTEERLQLLTRYAQEHPTNTIPLLPGYDWKRMHEICHRMDTAHSS
jgi:predicted Zn-dependent protease